MAEQQIFVSYSRHDAEFVCPLVQLLRVAPAFVFLDSYSIKPGDKWRTSLSRPSRVRICKTSISGSNPDGASIFQRKFDHLCPRSTNGRPQTWTTVDYRR